MIADKGPPEARIECLREAIAVSKRHWDRVAGVLRPMKTRPLLLEPFLSVLESLDLRVVVDSKDSLLFLISFVMGARAREVINLTFKDVTILGGGTAVKLVIRPSKNSTDFESTHSCQVGRRASPQVCRAGVTWNS